MVLAGGAYMMLVGGVGIWLWQEPGYFGKTSMLCATDVAVVRMPLLGNLRVGLGSSSLRACYLILYGVFLAVVAPSLVVATLSPGSLRWPTSTRVTRSKYPRTLIFLFLLSVATIIEIETTMKDNAHLEAEAAINWTFGQVLAAVLPLVSVKDIVRAVYASPAGKDRSESMGSREELVSGALSSCLAFRFLIEHYPVGSSKGEKWFAEA